MKENLEKLAKLIRYYILASTTAAGSGHPTSSLSAADLMAVLMFGDFYHYDLSNPDYINNDRLIFSKGHASPLFYSLWAVAAQTRTLAENNADSRGNLIRAMEPEEMLTLRKFGSRLEGHPTMEFPFTEVPTGSLGQGLSVGTGMALNAKLSAQGGSAFGGDKTLNYNTFVLLGDSEMAEGSNWEAMQIAAHYKLDNLIGILDVNRLGQRGETMFGWDTENYKKKCEAFGWETVVIDGHNLDEIKAAFIKLLQIQGKPKMIIAKTIKGKGISFLEDKDGKHGVSLKKEELDIALKELGEMDKTMVGQISMPEKEIEIQNVKIKNQNYNVKIKITEYDKSKPIATRKAYGNALVNLAESFPNLIVLDGETSNSTYAELVKKNHPEKFLEMYIAEQNMVGVAMGLSKRGKLPFVSTFAAFFTRAFDQIRMSSLAKSNIKFCGSHAGASIGEDGASQMGLEEIAMFRTLQDFTVLYPSDAVSTEKLVFEAAKHQGNVYIQTTRKETTIIYNNNDNFEIGGSKVLKSSEKDVATVISAGITVHEALAAYEELKKEGINIRVIDLYSIKPIDISTLQKAAKETKAIITVEDNHPEGGIAEAVASTILGTSLQEMERGGREVEKVKFASLAVRKTPHSGKPDELLAYEEINKDAIIKAVKALLNTD